MTWVTPAELAERRERATLARQRGLNSFPCPMIIRDGQGGIRGVQSMVDGRYYDSKRGMRQHYRETGHVEVGDQTTTPIYAPHKQPQSRADRDDNTARIRNDVKAAASKSNLTRGRRDQISIS